MSGNKLLCVCGLHKNRGEIFSILLFCFLWSMEVFGFVKLGFGDRFRCSSAAVFVLGGMAEGSCWVFWLLGFFVVFLLCS